jgi:4-azaleucine resistance transporter AzlC
MTDTGKNSTTAILRDGIAGAWPICLGYLAIGLAFGVIAQKAGLSVIQTGLMSLLVYAGSSQFIAVSMLGAGAGVVSIIFTTFAVNLRHLLMSSALATFLKNSGRGWLWLYAYGVTDESFAMNIARFRKEDWDWRRALVLNHTANLSWIGCTMAGACGGRYIPAGAFGLDYALPAMFICLLIFQCGTPLHVYVAVLSGITATALSLAFAGNFHVIIAAVAAAAAGVVLTYTQKNRDEEEHSNES